MGLIVLVLSVICYVQFVCVCTQKVELNGEWFLKDESGKHNNIIANVPGGIFSDLMNSKIIGDVLYGNNDTEVEWVGKTNWIYSRNFTVEPKILDFENINIVFEGLDTHSIIYINDVEIGTSQNMFVQYVFDVSKHLKAGNNIIEVKFLSPVNTGADLAKKQNYTIPPECPPDAYNGQCHVNQLRKMQASFAWDWGPSLPSVGIWKNVFIEAFNISVIRYLMVDISSAEDDWNILVTSYLSNNKKQVVKGLLSLDLQIDTTKIIEEIDVNERSDIIGNVVVKHSLTLPKNHVKLWWPNGYGSQKLYTLKAEFTDSAGHETSEKSIKIGFRTVELVQENVGNGLTFYFKVNDVPIFAKGSNSIPIDILPEKGQDKEKIQYLLQSAKDSHFNMLRVWGGGVYESDYFYETCDELGIMIWQDFMFACAMYPTYEDYLSNVVEEVRHQVKRLSHHPSIILWAGNNENELALRDNWYGTKKNFDQYKKDYVKLYIDTIKNEVAQISPNLKFLSSSPTNAKKSEEEGHIAEKPGDPLYGDVHFYNYIFDGFYDHVYPIPRFASEYGYQSLPSAETLLKATNNISDLNINSNFMNHRQHHPLGNLEMMRFINMQFGELDVTSEQYYRDFIYCTQVYQAMSDRVETEHYRSHRSSIDEKGQGMTMGALYWQLNDVWVAPTWSGIDYYGNWKMLQYFVKDSFSPIIATGYIDVPRNLNVYVVSDHQVPIFNATLVIAVYNCSSLVPLSQASITIDIVPFQSNKVYSENVDTHLSSVACGSESTAKNNCFVYLSLMKDSQRIAPDNFVFPNDIKHMSFQKPQIKIEKISQNDTASKSFEITLSTDSVALFVWLEALPIAGRFSENGFVLVSKTQTVYFQSNESVELDELKKHLSVFSLLNAKFQ